MQSFVKLIIGILLFSQITPAFAEKICSYSSYRWNTETRQADDIRRVNKPYANLTTDERDELTGCTVCEQDQAWIRVGSLEPVRMCWILANQVEGILNHALSQGFEINQAVAYRVGMTRGDVDQKGRRTKFSNHSYGIAIDINPDSNGLYENCLNFGENCRLRRGGEWQPVQNPYSIIADGDLVAAMKSAGFKWGGEILGRQKDFMHFSPSGY